MANACVYEKRPHGTECCGQGKMFRVGYFWLALYWSRAAAALSRSA